MKKHIAIAAAALLALSLAACSSPSPSAPADTNSNAPATAPATSANTSNFKSEKAINAITREDGSGTRGAFIELFGLEEKKDDGTKVDLISKDIAVDQNTNSILTTVADDTYAIGYVSMGSLNTNVKALKVDGVDATTENVKNGKYAAQRPFNIATKGAAAGLAKDFIDYILSADGQAIVDDKGYVSVSTAAAYAGDKPEGKLVVGGSTSVTPLMEKLIEGYKTVNPNATIELQTSDSGTGATKTIDGTYNIGMLSRELKDTESAELIGTEIAKDGIAVIVSKGNPMDDITKDAVKKIYLGETGKWNEI